MSDPTRKTRRLVLDRDEGRCVWCGSPWGDRLDLHHRVLRSHGTNNSPVNLIALCGSGTTGCHGDVHANPARSRTRGHIVPSWDDPAVVPVASWRGLILLTPDGEWREHGRIGDDSDEGDRTPPPSTHDPREGLNASSGLTGPRDGG